MTYFWFSFKQIMKILWYIFLNAFYFIRYQFYRIFTHKFCGDVDRNPIDKQGWALTFEDDFNGTEIDWTKWNQWWSTPDSCNSGTSPACPSLDCIKLEDGILQLLTIENTDPATKNVFPLKTGNLDSAYDEYCGNNNGKCETKVKGWEQQYGYFEIRCKVPPKGKMFWPAFWLWGNDWPPEIDIFEFMSKEDVEMGNSSEISMTLHWGQGNDLYHGQLGRKLKGINWDENYHIYACKWEWDSVTFYIDNVAVYKNTYNVASNKMSILISNGASWDYMPQASDLPGIFYVDYVRAYQQV